MGVHREPPAFDPLQDVRGSTYTVEHQGLMSRKSVMTVICRRRRST